MFDRWMSTYKEVIQFMTKSHQVWLTAGLNSFLATLFLYTSTKDGVPQGFALYFICALFASLIIF